MPEDGEALGGAAGSLVGLAQLVVEAVEDDVLGDILEQRQSQRVQLVQQFGALQLCSGLADAVPQTPGQHLQHAALVEDDAQLARRHHRHQHYGEHVGAVTGCLLWTKWIHFISNEQSENMYYIYSKNIFSLLQFFLSLSLHKAKI